MEGIENIKKVIGFGLEIAKDVVKAKADGKVDWKDGYLVIDDIPKIPAIIKAVPRLKAEFMDLTEQEKTGILTFVRERAVCPGEHAQDALEASFMIVLDLALMIDHISDLALLLKKYQQNA